jgi:hypothetical protein
VVRFRKTDDADRTREFIAVIRGKGTTGKEMYGPGDTLPSGYEHLRVENYCDCVMGGFRRYGVVATEDDVDSMLDHALIQARLRYRITPSRGGDDV